MKGINKVILLGVVGKDPEIRYSQSGNCVASFSLATNSKYKDKRTGEQIEKATWHQCVAFNKTGELVGEYVRKGSKLYIEGSIDHQQYEKDGETKYITKITVKDFVICNSVEGKNTQSNNQEKQQGQNSGNAHNNNYNAMHSDIPDSEIPF